MVIIYNNPVKHNFMLMLRDVNEKIYPAPKPKESQLKKGEWPVVNIIQCAYFPSEQNSIPALPLMRGMYCQLIRLPSYVLGCPSIICLPYVPMSYAFHMPSV